MGKRRFRNHSKPFVSVQPHVCGEKQGMENRNSFHVGSTPRVWGKGLAMWNTEGKKRFNPTCVGKSGHVSIGPILQPVQPHVCGEKVLIFLGSAFDLGSTPRVWGKVSFFLRLALHFRFNPTCVGKSAVSRVASLASPVQPHVCGEKMNGKS